MANYGRVHRFLLRSVASRGVLTMADAKLVLSDFTDSEGELSITDMVREINEQIRPLQQSIKIANDELTNEQVLVFLSLGCDDATKAQGVFSAIELEYFRILLEQIMTTESRQVTAIYAVNLVSGLKPTISKTDAQKILDLWCQMKYLDKDQNNYALGIRTIHEFEDYFRQNMPDTIEECCLCKHIVFRGYNCPACGLAVHTLCLNKYRETVDKWPCCKYDFDPAQLERLNSEGHRLTQSRSDASQMTIVVQQPQDETIENTQEMHVDMTQDLIHGISQRVSRKRRRQE